MAIPETIVAKVRVPKEGAEGVLATCGGRFGGYAMYVKNDRLTYVHNFVGDERETGLESIAFVCPNAICAEASLFI